MSDFAQPSSLRLELEARRMHMTAQVAGPADAVLGLTLSRFPLALDFFVWAAAAVLVFPATIFQGLERNSALLAGLGLWLLAYAARPAGVWVFKTVRRRHGRGVALTAGRFLLGASTFAVAFLPVSSGSGAVVLLAGARLLQGIAMGGVSNGVSSGGAPRAGGGLAWRLAGLAGLIACAAALAAVVAGLEQADFLDWGWRYPFVIAIPVNIVALFADLRLLTTGETGTTDRRRVARLVSAGGVPVDPRA
jgi:MFS family permease